jgi:ligand-binding sensor domain-containing protein
MRRPGRRCWVGWLAAWLISVGGCWGQTRPAGLVFQHMQQANGLSHNFTNCLLRDRDGFLWIGTFDGLNRYDGHRVEVFKHSETNPNTLPHNTVHALCEDHDGNIWMALEDGISCYQKQTGRFIGIQKTNQMLLGHCANILCDSRGDIWFTSRAAGLHRYAVRTGQLQQFLYNPANRPPGPYVSQIAKNGLVHDPTRNGLWVADEYAGLQYFDKEQQRFTNHSNNPGRLPVFTRHHVSALAIDGNQLIFADNVDKQFVFYSLTQQRIVKTLRPVIRQKNREVFDVATIFVDRQHNLWVSSWNYVTLHINRQTDAITELIHDDALPTSVAASFFWSAWQHPDGSIWLATINGISHTNPNLAFYSVYNLEKTYPALSEMEGITCIHEADDGTWWLGTHGRGVLKYTPQTNQLTVLSLPGSASLAGYGGYVTDILPDGSGLLVAYYGGFCRLDKQTGAMRPIPLPREWMPLSEVRAAVYHNGQIWVGNEAGQVFSYAPASGRWQGYRVRSNLGQAPQPIRKLLIDSTGHLWAHIHRVGFARFDSRTNQLQLEQPTAHSGFNKRAFQEVIVGGFDQQGAIWMASNGFGLWRYTPYAVRYDHWTESNGLAFDRALSALPDKQGNIWVGSYNQFTVFTPAQNRFQRFTLPINVANAAYVNMFKLLRNGHMLAALKGHLVEFIPEKLSVAPASATETVLLSRLTTSDTVRLLHGGVKAVQLRADDNSFTLDFSVLVPPGEPRFAFMYQLEGYDDWKKVGNIRYAVYNKLPGGDYTFRVKAVDADGRETPVAELPIYIDTYFYKTDWFKLLMLLVVGAIAFGGYRFRLWQTSRVHALQMQATQLERDKTRIQYQNLINHLNPHFLFNSLTSLNSLIITAPQLASEFLEKLATIYRYILQSKDRETVTLDHELSFVQNYIDLQQARFEDGLCFQIDIPATYRSGRVVPVTLQNLFENAIKHNIINDDSPLTIRVYVQDNYLYVTNNLQRKRFVQTSNKQGLDSLSTLYRYLSDRPLLAQEQAGQFVVKVPLL